MVVAVWDLFEVMPDVIGPERFQTLRAFVVDIRSEHRCGEIGRRLATVFGNEAVHGPDVKRTHPRQRVAARALSVNDIPGEVFVHGLLIGAVATSPEFYLYPRVFRDCGRQ